MKLFLLMFIAMHITSSSAWACTSKIPNPHTVIDKSIFIGKVRAIKIVKIELQEENSDSFFRPDSKITFEVIQPYKDTLHQETIEAYAELINSCKNRVPKLGQVYEENFTREGDRIFLSSQLTVLLPDTLRTLRAQAPETPKLKALEEECVDRKGVWGMKDERIPDFSCKHHASDADKSCTADEQCKGECIKPLTDDQAYDLMTEKTRPEDLSHIEGKCSPWEKSD